MSTLQQKIHKIKPTLVKKKRATPAPTDEIFFKSTKYNGYSFLSNFYPFLKPGALAAVKAKHPDVEQGSFVIDGKRFLTAEHYYQSQKFAGTPAEDQIRRCETALDAKKLNTVLKKKHALPKDWSTRQFDVMYKGLLAKFSQNPQLLKALQSTGDKPLHETRGRTRDLWSFQPDGTADNLGRLLMRARSELAV